MGGGEDNHFGGGYYPSPEVLAEAFGVIAETCAEARGALHRVLLHLFWKLQDAVYKETNVSPSEIPMMANLAFHVYAADDEDESSNGGMVDPDGGAKGGEGEGGVGGVGGGRGDSRSLHFEEPLVGAGTDEGASYRDGGGDEASYRESIRRGRNMTRMEDRMDQLRKGAAWAARRKHTQAIERGGMGGGDSGSSSSVGLRGGDGGAGADGAHMGAIPPVPHYVWAGELHEYLQSLEQSVSEWTSRCTRAATEGDAAADMASEWAVRDTKTKARKAAVAAEVSEEAM